MAENEIQSILLQHQKLVLPELDVLAGPEEFDRMDIRRSHVWADTIRSMTKSNFTGQKWLRVHFVLEEAVDDGGPKREFLRLAMQECSQSNLFAGPLEARTVSQNVSAIQQKKYLVAGEIAYVHTYIHTYIHTYTHTHTHTYQGRTRAGSQRAREPP